ncbi:MAG: RidA family protein [Rhodobacteraceae bacterium]|nr:RidA family protein [Paracoccaceae bacterium]
MWTCVCVATLASCWGASLAYGQEIIRHAIPGSSFPISRAVEVPGNATVIYLSGAVPAVINDGADPNSPEAFGNTEAQTVSVLKSIEATLSDLDLKISDVVKMQVFLVEPDGADGMDFAGFMAGYTQFFGTDTQPQLPVRSVFEVAGLANPAWLVEIEVTAVRPVSP